MFPLDDLLIDHDARRVDLTLPADSPRVRIDRGRAFRALTNVLSNADKCSPQVGAIELTLRRRRRVREPK